VYVPLLLQMDAQFAKPNAAAAFDLLRGCDYQAKSDSSAAAVYEAFWRHLLKDTFNDDLPEFYWTNGGNRWSEVMRQITAESGWWDDKSTTDLMETRDEILKRSFIKGVAELEDLLGTDPAQWKWGYLYTSTFRKGTLGQS